MKRSTIGGSAIRRLFWRIVRHPRIAAKLVELQIGKWCFPLLHPSAAEGRAGRIRQVSIRITDLCNLRCLTCGQWGATGFLRDASLRDLKRDEVSPERYRVLFADLAGHGHHPLVYFWGGEPMLYPGTVELIEVCTRLGMPVSIATNGTGIAQAVPALCTAPLFLLQVSIDGPNAEIHNRIRPAASGADNYADIRRALEAVAYERRRGLPLVASLTTICRENSAHLAAIYESVQDQVDVAVFYLAWWIDAPAAARHEADFTRRFGFAPTLHRGWIGSWRPDDFAGLSRQLTALQDLACRPHMPALVILPALTKESDLRRYYTEHDERFGYDECVSIFHAVEINSNGDMSPCRDYHDYVVGNVKRNSIPELWESEAYRKFRASIRNEGLMPVCTRCCGLMGY